MSDQMAAMMNRVFTKRKITANTWVIEGVGCYTYLLLGQTSAILIDSGMSKRDLKAYCEEITNLPIIGVINTHGHFDHTGGNGWFAKALMHPLAVSIAKTPFPSLEGYNLDYEIETLADGQVIDLGDRPFEIMYIGAHSPGSIAILDKNNRLLFTGDELESGQVLLMLEQEGAPVTQTVENHQRNMKMLKARMSEYDYICPSHNGTMMHNSYVDIFIEAEQNLLDGAEGSDDINSPTWPMPNNGFTKRYEYKGANICYDVRRVKDL